MNCVCVRNELTWYIGVPLLIVVTKSIYQRQTSKISAAQSARSFPSNYNQTKKNGGRDTLAPYHHHQTKSKVQREKRKPQLTMKRLRLLQKPIQQTTHKAKFTQLPKSTSFIYLRIMRKLCPFDEREDDRIFESDEC